jgi:NCAIR mutase (PurE)-related protein
MQREELETLVTRLLDGGLARDEFLQVLTRSETFGAPGLEKVTLDLDRRRRCGFPEAVFGEGKSVETLRQIFRRLLGDGQRVLATRVTAEKAELLVAEFPTAHYNGVARTLRIDPASQSSPEPRASNAAFASIAVVTAGTTDFPVAEEARETLAWMGVPVTMLQDIGVAGPQRLLERLEELRDHAAVIVVAGMEGALPSVVGGWVDCPVIGVPTSVGYGANFGGLSALLSMLNSCAANVTVVNIDAGFKAGYLAGLIARGTLRDGTVKGNANRH